MNLSHDPRFRTGGLDHFFGNDDDDEGPRYPESLAPPAPWTLVNVHGDSDDDVWDRWHPGTCSSRLGRLGAAARG